MLVLVMVLLVLLVLLRRATTLAPRLPYSSGACAILSLDRPTSTLLGRHASHFHHKGMGWGPAYFRCMICWG